MGEAMIEVVSGLMIRDGRVLLTQRRPGKDYPFTWETPGGNVESQESAHKALRRELREEIMIHAITISDTPIAQRAFAKTPSHSDLVLNFYRVLEWTGAPWPREGQGIGWFTADEMRRLTLAPGNLAALDRIVEEIGR